MKKILILGVIILLFSGCSNEKEKHLTCTDVYIKKNDLKNGITKDFEVIYNDDYVSYYKINSYMPKDLIGVETEKDLKEYVKFYKHSYPEQFAFDGYNVSFKLDDEIVIVILEVDMNIISIEELKDNKLIENVMVKKDGDKDYFSYDGLMEFFDGKECTDN